MLFFTFLYAMWYYFFKSDSVYVSAVNRYYTNSKRAVLDQKTAFSWLCLDSDPVVSSFLCACLCRSGRSVMALSWSEEFSPGKQKQMLPPSGLGKVCCCFLLSSATAGQCWGFLMISPCWLTPKAMGLELRWFLHFSHVSFI